MYYYPGATAVGIKAANGVVLAADKRVTYGFTLMSRSGKKVFKITDKLSMASAGFIADMQVIAKNIEAEIRLYELESGQTISVYSAAKLMSLLLYNRRLYPYMVEVIVGGVDSQGAHIYILDPIGAVIEDEYATLGTGSQVAIGIIEDSYRKDISLEDAKALAIKAVKAAFSRDAVSGDGIDVITISDEGSEEEFIPVKS
ncbi:MAG TPA: archaeal proteasome endopeptidase complex subunit beta [Thermofilum sp.]|nr:archaeal proteasome endopeptidase complex subunit beta [Thermofilum sp.]